MVLKKDATTESIKIRLFELCTANLPEYEQPASFVFIDKPPLTSIGKVDYLRLETIVKDKEWQIERKETKG